MYVFLLLCFILFQEEIIPGFKILSLIIIYTEVEVTIKSCNHISVSIEFNMNSLSTEIVLDILLGFLFCGRSDQYIS